MKLFQSRAIWGILLIVAGVLFLLQEFDILPGANLIWPIVFGVVGLAFLYQFVTDRAQWWPVIPGLAMLGIALLILWGEFAPEPIQEWGAVFFMGGLSLAFWIVYFANRENWWAVIPGGALLTLAVVIFASSMLEGIEVAGVFFLGMGLTFGLVALLPTPEGRMTWAFIPALVFLVMGALITAAAAEIIAYVWPAALILAGVYVLIRALTSR
jgi:hypothetical protein